MNAAPHSRFSDTQGPSGLPLGGALAPRAGARYPWRQLVLLIGPAGFAIVLLLLVNAASGWLALVIELTLLAESRSSRDVQEAARHAARYVRTGSDEHRRDYEQLHLRLEGSRQARIALAQVPMDIQSAQAGMQRAGHSAHDAREMLLMMQIIGHVPSVRQAREHWAIADQLLIEMGQVVAEARAMHERSHPPGDAAALLVRLGRIADRLAIEGEGFRNSFSNAARDIRRVQQTAVLALGLALLVLSVWAAAQTLQRMHRDRLLLQRAHERFYLAATVVNDGIWDWDLRRKVVAWTPRLRELLGFDNDTHFAAAFTLRSHIHPDDAPTTFHRLRRHIEGDSPRLDVQLRLRCMDGEYRWFRFRGMAQFDAARQPVRVLGTITDVHEHVLAQRAQQATQRMWQQTATELDLAMDAAHVALWRFNPATGEVLHHRRWESVLGYHGMPDTVAGWSALVHPEDRPGRDQELARHLAGTTQFFELEYRMRHAEGHWVWLRSRGRVTRRAADGRPLEYAGTVMNVTLEVAARQAQRLQFQFTETLIEGIDTGIMLSGLDRIEYVNSGLCRLLGYTKEQMVGKPITFFIASPDVAAAAVERRRQAMKGSEIPLTVLDVRDAGGQTLRVVSATTHIVWNGVSHFISTVTPHSQYEELEARLQSAQARFERTLLAELESQQAHLARELHDSLGSVLAGLSLLLAGAQAQAARGQPVADTLARCQDQVREAAETTRALARGILPVGTHEGALHQALERFAHDIESVMGVQADLEVHADLDTVDAATANHIYRVIQEAVSNAVRHGHATRVRILAQDSQRARTFIVQDNGRGMPPASTSGGEGVGLRSMRARADAVGGTLTLGVANLGGVEVILRVPRQWHPPEADETTRR